MFFFTCGKNCAIFPHLRNTGKFSDSEENQYSIQNYVNHKSVDVVYGVFCEICNKIIYVEETGDTLYQRHLLSLSLISRKAEDPVVNHIYTNFIMNIFPCLYGKIFTKNKFYRKK